MAVVIPPDTRADFDANHTPDHDNISDVLGVLAQALAQLAGTVSTDNPTNLTAVQNLIAGTANVLTDGAFAATGLTGAVAGARFAGATATGAPASGTFATGDFVIARSGSIWICTAGGTPGTWVQVTAASGMTNPMTTRGDLIYETSGVTPGRLAGPTSATKQFLTSTGTGTLPQDPAWGTIAAADLPTGTTAAKGALQLDGTAADIAPVGIQAAGTLGTAAIADHSHAHNGLLSLLYAPTGALAETVSRRHAGGAAAVLTSGTLHVTAIGLPKGLVVSSATFVTNTTAGVTVTHGWYVLLDSARVVRAVTADTTTSWGATGTAYPLSFTAPYTTTATGLYYLGIMIAATTMPTFTTAAGLSTGIGTLTPVLNGASSTAQTTPPATGATMGAITGSGSNQFYAYLS